MKRIAIACALVAALFTASSAANAERIGVGVSVGGPQIGVGIGVGAGHPGHPGGGWDHRPGGGDWDHHPYRPFPLPIPVPVPVNPYPYPGYPYPNPPYYNHPPIQVTVPEQVQDPNGGYHIVYVRVWAYWDPVYHQYFYTDNYGRQVPVN